MSKKPGLSPFTPHLTGGRRHPARTTAVVLLLATAIASLVGYHVDWGSHDATGLPIKQQFLQHSSAFGTTNHPITPSLKGVAPKQCSMALQQGHLPSSRILITGAAGFIGFHTARALWSNQQQSHAERPFLLGLDAFTPQPGPPEYGSIKRTRQQMLLSCCDITVVEGDIHNTALLHDLFSCYNFTQVVHLAGQAGVRQSVAAPTSYVSMNVEGTVSLLEVMRRQQMPPTLVYASSSSVYGAAGPKRRAPTGGSRPCNKHATDISNSSGAGTLAHCSSPTSAALGDSDVSSTPGPLPLAPTGLAASTGSGSTMHGPSHEQDVASAQPRSVYAASKLAVEHLVAVYHHQYKMSAVGLRFFTVYGPWGRPDMSVMSMAHRLQHHLPINITCFPTSSLQLAPEASNKQLSGTVSTSMLTYSGSQFAAGRAAYTYPVQCRGLGRPVPVIGTKTQRSSSTSTGQPEAHAVQERFVAQQAAPPSCQPPLRDFTYIDDVVRGILAACNAAASAAAAGRPLHDVYNFGRGKPESVLTILRHLQQLTCKPAVGVAFDMVSGSSSPDVDVTWADTSAARGRLGWVPSWDLQQGLEKFAAWFSEYTSGLATE